MFKSFLTDGLVNRASFLPMLFMPIFFFLLQLLHIISDDNLPTKYVHRNEEAEDGSYATYYAQILGEFHSIPRNNAIAVSY